MRTRRTSAVRFTGPPIRIAFKPDLTAWRGKLLSGDKKGRPVLAGSFPRRREIVLDRDLLAKPRQLARIVLHEVFHFVWPRLGNPARLEWERVLQDELASRVEGEAGWSSEWRKARLRARDLERRTRRWREYACESFCDTAAWLFSGPKRHSEVTLRRSGLHGRRRWFRELLDRRSGRLPI
ncbi:MAG TPA: hypothetical protein VFL57_19295 [Bryobacteraceae bacterium]|nr:hypothetical protein [Bryobacteraceae bacterium]